jgi:hypothetical protein
MLSALSVPREHIHSVEYVADPLTAIQGFKASGVGLPRLKMGTWHHDGQKDFVIANSHVPGLVIDLMDEHYSRLILSVQDAEQVVARLSGAGSSSG